MATRQEDSPMIRPYSCRAFGTRLADPPGYEAAAAGATARLGARAAERPVCRVTFAPAEDAERASVGSGARPKSAPA